MDTSYLTQQVTSIIGQLHHLFDEIGVPSHDRESREAELFSSLSETLHNHLRLVSSEKNEMVSEGQRIITTIQQMEASLDDTKKNSLYASDRDELKITYPLMQCLRLLKEKHKTMSKLHQERYEQVKKLVQALESYSSHLEPSFIKIKLPPVSADGVVPPSFDLSPSYINSVDTEFSRVYEEYTKRVAFVQQLSEEIVKTWAELGTPQAQTDPTIVKYWRDSPEQLGLHQDDINKLTARRDRLAEEKRGRERKLKELRGAVEGLWDRLNIDQQERKPFLARTRGCGLRTINDLEDELARLNELKRQNLHLFVEDARTRLQTLWDELFFSEEEAVEFTPMFCDVFSDALLSAHENEIARLETLKEQRASLLQLISKHRSLLQDKNDLAASSQDGSRLLATKGKGERRDPTRLLREEKMRKRIARELPKVEQEVINVLENWEEEYGRPFLVFGERYIDIIQEAAAKAPPPRSKTPNAMSLPPRPTTAKPAPAAAKAPGSREPSTLRAKTPVGGSTLKGNPLASSTRSGPSAPTTASGTLKTTSPSRIPARVPLSHMPYGNNSPERQRPNQAVRDQENAASVKSTTRPLMAPPPKMRDLQPHQTSATSTPSRYQQPDTQYSGSIVRQCPPEDPYSDRPTSSSSYQQQSRNFFDQHPQYHDMPPPPRPTYHNYSEQDSVQRSHHPDKSSYAPSSTASTVSRHASNTSSCAAASTASSHTTVNSASENWETFEESEICEDDPQSHGGRQGTPGIGGKRPYGEVSGYSTTSRAAYGKNMGLGKKMKAMDVDINILEGHRILSGSEAGWTDEDAG